MAAELITPLDEISGIPLPILPQEYLPYNDPRKANWHHPWHAESAPALQTLGGKALRHSRVQLVRATDHNQGNKRLGKLTYHDFYVGPSLPTDETEQFNRCVIAAAGYVPDRAIDLRGDEPAVVRMSNKQIALLREPALPGVIRRTETTRLQKKAAEAYAMLVAPTMTEQEYIWGIMADFRARQERQTEFGLHHLVYQYQPMRDFFQSVVLSQDLSHVRENKVDEFLSTHDPDRKTRLARWLLAQAVDKTTDSVARPYQALSRAGKLHPRMPARANVLVLYKLGPSQDRTRLALQHEEKLRASLGLAAA